MLRVALFAALAWLGCAHPGAAQELKRLSLATAPWIERTGLLDHLLLAFQTDTNIHVTLLPASDTPPLEAGRRGEVDALLLPGGTDAEAFVRDGFGIDAGAAFHTDFVLIGPEKDPAAVAGVLDVSEALRRIAAAKAPFASRGDDSGPHKLELSLWRAAGVDPLLPGVAWYHPAKSGARDTLTAAKAQGAYMLAGRLTWARFSSGAEAAGLRLLSSGDPRLLVTVHSLRVDAHRARGVRAEEARLWNAWLLSAPGQSALATFRVEGHPVFFPAQRPPLIANLPMP